VFEGDDLPGRKGTARVERAKPVRGGIEEDPFEAAAGIISEL
jgi:hypothetical protein